MFEMSHGANDSADDGHAGVVCGYQFSTGPYAGVRLVASDVYVPFSLEIFNAR